MISNIIIFFMIWTVVLIVGIPIAIYFISCNNANIRNWIIDKLANCGCKNGKCS